MNEMPLAGDPAPAFALPDESGTVHSLADRAGEWTVVYFYPEDGTSGCTTEACEFRDSFASIRAEGAEVWESAPTMPPAMPNSGPASSSRSRSSPTRARR